MVVATEGGIEDLDVETQFFLENCLSYLTRSAWNKLKAAEATGGGIEDLDAETQFFLENCLAYLTRSAWNQLKAAEKQAVALTISTSRLNSSWRPASPV